MGKQLDLFTEQSEYNIGDIVDCDFCYGLDLLKNKERVYTGGNWGFVLKLTQYNTHVVVHFPANVDPNLKHCTDNWFEFSTLDIKKVRMFGFNEIEFRKTYSPKPVP